jgi:hypothetical protein
MGSKAIRADAPILSPRISCGDDRSPCRCLEHCGEGETGNTNIQIAVELAFIREKALRLIAMKELPS